MTRSFNKVNKFVATINSTLCGAADHLSWVRRSRTAPINTLTFEFFLDALFTFPFKEIALHHVTQKQQPLYWKYNQRRAFFNYLHHRPISDQSFATVKIASFIWLLKCPSESSLCPLRSMTMSSLAVVCSKILAPPPNSWMTRYLNPTAWGVTEMKGMGEIGGGRCDQGAGGMGRNSIGGLFVEVPNSSNNVD